MYPEAERVPEPMHEIFSARRFLDRIRGRTYGTCEDCNGVIAKKRLEAIPFASLCIRCAEKQEQGFGGRPRQPR